MKLSDHLVYINGDFVPRSEAKIGLSDLGFRAGYSVYDTIVIFDRIRENVILSPNRSFRMNVNISINESITRSLATSLTTLTVILAMLLFGGVSLRDFLYVLLLGVMIGTYSAIFIASQILVAWESRGFLIWRKKIQ